MNLKTKTLGIILFLVLLACSLFKDAITPDYLNTPPAFMLNPANPDYRTIFELYQTHTLFWVKAHLFSLLFIVIPASLIYIWYNKQLAMFTLYLLAVIYVIEYAIVWAQHPMLNVHILPKVNRYFHSPFVFLFLFAAFTLLPQKE
ncbi:MAG: hypothetical protein MUE96_08915 [Bacteroidia bacterium]|jgi:hypothetical protein|nr:hypothetical protein [Bacteroidia bacterium]